VGLCALRQFSRDPAHALRPRVVGNPAQTILHARKATLWSALETCVNWAPWVQHHAESKRYPCPRKYQLRWPRRTAMK